VNTNGDLIGINSQILGGMTGGNIGIGFAIPSNMVKSVMDQLIKSGKVRRGSTRHQRAAVDSDMAQSLGMSETKRHHREFGDGRERSGTRWNQARAT
jgi:S1-C subfamily serine protease